MFQTHILQPTNGRPQFSRPRLGTLFGTVPFALKTAVHEKQLASTRTNGRSSVYDFADGIESLARYGTCSYTHLLVSTACFLGKSTHGWILSFLFSLRAFGDHE